MASPRAQIRPGLPFAAVVALLLRAVTVRIRTAAARGPRSAQDPSCPSCRRVSHPFLAARLRSSCVMLCPPIRPPLRSGS